MRFLPAVIAIVLGLGCGLIMDPGIAFVYGMPLGLISTLGVVSFALALIWPSGFWKRSLLVLFSFLSALLMKSPFMLAGALEERGFMTYFLWVMLPGCFGAVSGVGWDRAWRWARRRAEVGE